MIDCSRNGVLLVSAVQDLLRHCALMGCNMLQLYTEDTYKIPHEPFFGYFRGGYTAVGCPPFLHFVKTLNLRLVRMSFARLMITPMPWALKPFPVFKRWVTWLRSFNGLDFIICAIPMMFCWLSLMKRTTLLKRFVGLVGLAV